MQKIMKWIVILQLVIAVPATAIYFYGMRWLQESVTQENVKASALANELAVPLFQTWNAGTLKDHLEEEVEISLYEPILEEVARRMSGIRNQQDRFAGKSEEELRDMDNVSEKVKKVYVKGTIDLIQPILTRAFDRLGRTTNLQPLECYHLMVDICFSRVPSDFEKGRAYITIYLAEDIAEYRIASINIHPIE